MKFPFYFYEAMHRLCKSRRMECFNCPLKSHYCLTQPITYEAEYVTQRFFAEKSARQRLGLKQEAPLQFFSP